jgi:hypothetical protein
VEFINIWIACLKHFQLRWMFNEVQGNTIPPSPVYFDTYNATTFTTVCLYLLCTHITANELCTITKNAFWKYCMTTMFSCLTFCLMLLLYDESVIRTENPSWLKTALRLIWKDGIEIWTLINIWNFNETRFIELKGCCSLDGCVSASQIWMELHE